MVAVYKELGNGVSEDSSKGEEKISVEIDSVAEKALDKLKNSEATDWIGPSPILVECAKQGAEGIFSRTGRSFLKAPLKKLYTERFDVEQIWQQIDLQSVPVFSYLRRRVKTIEKATIDNSFVLPEDPSERRRNRVKGDQVKDQEIANRKASRPEQDDDENSDGSNQNLDDPEEHTEEEEEDEDDDDEDDALKNPIEDDFFRVSEMEKFLDKADAEENGLSDISGSDGDEDQDDLEADEAGFSGDHDEDNEGEEDKGDYEEFFGKDKKRKVKFNVGEQNKLEDSDQEDGSNEGGMSLAQKEIVPTQEDKLSGHEKRLLKRKKRIEILEKANIDPKDWTMQGEVTARKRPKNSALEVELEFDHNARPPPVITEEVTASLEDMIKARIAEGRFDDVVRRFVATEPVPRERIELDENKSQKGLGELYEGDYAEKTGLAVAPITSTDDLKNKATVLFKSLCSRLDSLSHFSFTPKPIIEDMGVRADVPALAMEEVAPLAVSDASMLAPEEVFKGEDGLKAEGELTPDERKRRRAQKKRKRKGEKRLLDQLQARKKPRPTGLSTDGPRGTPGLKIAHSSFSKSTKVFAALDKAKGGNGKLVSRKDDKQLPRGSDLKL